MGTTRIDLFFDVISPYSWIAFEALCRYRTLWNIDLRFRPFFAAGVMYAAGNQPPVLIPSKADYMMEKDLQRLRNYWSVPIGRIKDPKDSIHEKGSLAAQRYLVSLSRHKPEKMEDAARELWMRRWSRDEDINLADHFIEVSRKIGLPKILYDTVVAEIELKEVKDELKSNTSEAVEQGAFGTPWIHVYINGKIEPFFGSDRFHIIADLIGEKYSGPVKHLSKL